jgi:Trehalose-6-phosphatase
MHAFEEIIARTDVFALFFDIDGTLIDIAPRPDDVVVSEELCRNLVRARLRYDGAVALLSGRSLSWIEQRFGDAVTAVGACTGLNGATRAVNASAFPPRRRLRRRVRRFRPSSP